MAEENWRGKSRQDVGMRVVDPLRFAERRYDEIVDLLRGSFDVRENFAEHKLHRSCTLLSKEPTIAASIEPSSSSQADALIRACSERATTSGLPRHLRRRPGSHLRFVRQYPPPKYTKKKPKGDRSGGEVSILSRRGRRKRQVMHAPGYRCDDSRGVRLETHVWHTKRMIMKRTWWGYRVGSRRQDRAVRAFLTGRTRKKDAAIRTVHDASYVACIQLRGLERRVVETVLALAGPEIPFWTPKDLAGTRHLRDLEMHWPKAFPFGLIAPVQFHWIPPSSLADDDDDDDERRRNAHIRTRRAWIWVHECARADLLEALRLAVGTSADVHIDDFRHAFVRFEIRGPRALDLLLTRPRHDASHPRVKIEESVDEREKSDASGNCRMTCGVVRPTKGRLGNSPCTAETVPVDLATLRDLCKAVGPEESGSARLLRKVCGRASSSDAKNAESAARRSATDASPTVSTTSLWDMSSRWHLVDGDRSLVETVTQDSQRDATSSWPLAIFESSDASSIDVVAPAGRGRELWQLLVLSGGRAAGVEERRVLRAQRGLATFPEDYPETRAGERDEAFRASELEAIDRRRPKGKRPNYKSLSAPFAYRPKWDICCRAECEEEEEEKVSDDLPEKKKEEEEVKGTFDPRESTDTPPGTRVVPFCVLRRASLVRDVLSVRAKLGPTLQRKTLISVRLIGASRGRVSAGAMICMPEVGELTPLTLLPRTKGSSPLLVCGGTTTRRLLPVERPGAASNRDMTREIAGFVTCAADCHGRMSAVSCGVGLCGASKLWTIARRTPKLLRDRAPVEPCHRAVGVALARSKTSLRFFLVWVCVRAS